MNNFFFCFSAINQTGHSPTKIVDTWTIKVYLCVVAISNLFYADTSVLGYWKPEKREKNWNSFKFLSVPMYSILCNLVNI